ncbi:MAG: alpha/beta hydrolase fold domain-containing protein [Planctomycetota bacterium]
MVSEIRRAFHRDATTELQVAVRLPHAPHARCPTLIWISGGGWMHMGLGGLDRLDWIRAHGFALAGIEYRTAPTHRFPVAVRDVFAGVRFLAAAARELGLDPRQRVICGDSAGGHLSALVALAPEMALFRDQRHCAGRQTVDGCIAFMPPTDLRGMTAAGRGFLEAFLGGDPTRGCMETAIAASPVTYVHPGTPPFLLIHGRRDTLVTIDHSRWLYAALARAGVSRRLIELPGITHDANALYNHPTSTAAMLRFLRSHLA